MGKHQREKGARAEREAAELWQLAGFTDARRRATGEEAQEAQGRDLKGTPGFCVQVKNSRRDTVHGALAEARAAARPLEVPLAFYRRDRLPFVVVLAPEDFFLMVCTLRGMPLPAPASGYPRGEGSDG